MCILEGNIANHRFKIINIEYEVQPSYGWFFIDFTFINIINVLI